MTCIELLKYRRKYLEASPQLPIPPVKLSRRECKIFLRSIRHNFMLYPYAKADLTITGHTKIYGIEVWLDVLKGRCDEESVSER